MKVKYLVLFLILILCSGCSIDYTLKIDERNLFTEEFRLIPENDQESEELCNDPFPYKSFYDDLSAGDYPEKLDGVSYYATEILQNGRFYTKQFHFTFYGNQFSRASSVRTCYEYLRFTEDAKQGTMTLRTSSEFLCMESYPNISNVTIRVESSNPIVTTNADEVTDNTCIWHIDQNNYLERSLILTIQNSEPKASSEEAEVQEKPVSPLLVLTILGGFVVFLIVIFLYNYKQQNRYEKY